MTIYDKIKQLEGGYTSIDGGTKWGVIQATYKQFYQGDVRNMNEAQFQIIVDMLWRQSGAPKIANRQKAEFFFLWWYNAGKNATKDIQRRNGLQIDGVVGKDTANAIRITPINTMALWQSEYYKRLATSNPSKYSQYENGWLNRVKDTLALVAKPAVAGVAIAAFFFSAG